MHGAVRKTSRAPAGIDHARGHFQLGLHIRGEGGLENIGPFPLVLPVEYFPAARQHRHHVGVIDGDIVLPLDRPGLLGQGCARRRSGSVTGWGHRILLAHDVDLRSLGQTTAHDAPVEQDIVVLALRCGFTQSLPEGERGGVPNEQHRTWTSVLATADLAREAEAKAGPRSVVAARAYDSDAVGDPTKAMRAAAAPMAVAAQALRLAARRRSLAARRVPTPPGADTPLTVRTPPPILPAVCTPPTRTGGRATFWQTCGAVKKWLSLTTLKSLRPPPPPSTRAVPRRTVPRRQRRHRLRTFVLLVGAIAVAALLTGISSDLR